MVWICMARGGTAKRPDPPIDRIQQSLAAPKVRDMRPTQISEQLRDCRKQLVLCQIHLWQTESDHGPLNIGLVPKQYHGLMRHSFETR
jgi:hypothetical protein